MIALRPVSILLALAASSLVSHVAAKPRADGSCDAKHTCDDGEQCCSSAGFCGTGSEYCLAGCNPYGSLSFDSCAALPRCQNQSISFKNNASPWTKLSSYNGDPSVAPLTLDSGSVVTGQNYATLLVTKKGKNEGGSELSTTRYFLYGTATARMRHDVQKGIVSALVLMSPTGDEVDIEMTTKDPASFQTTWYWNVAKYGPTYPGNEVDQPKALPADFDGRDWHDYTVDWSPEALTWKIDGQVIRTAHRKKTKDAKGYYEYPATPARVQISLWNAGDADEAPGTVQWAGGKPDWSKAHDDGAFHLDIQRLDVTCNDPADIGSGSAYDFSRKLDKSTGEPKVITSNRKTTV